MKKAMRGHGFVGLASFTNRGPDRPPDLLVAPQSSGPVKNLELRAQNTFRRRPAGPVLCGRSKQVTCGRYSTQTGCPHPISYVVTVTTSGAPKRTWPLVVFNNTACAPISDPTAGTAPNMAV